jgi:hypothetical protein
MERSFQGVLKAANLNAGQTNFCFTPSTMSTHSPSYWSRNWQNAVHVPTESPSEFQFLQFRQTSRLFMFGLNRAQIRRRNRAVSLAPLWNLKPDNPPVVVIAFVAARQVPGI